MKKEIIISGILVIVGIIMINIALIFQTDKSMVIEEKDIKNMAASANMYIKEKNNYKNNKTNLVPVDMQTAPVAIIVPPRIEVYDGMTIEELSAKINRNLGDGYIANKGELIATYSIEKGVDPYVATAIMLHETGCNHKCSGLVRQCNNVGGQKGYPSCGGGSFKRFDTLDEGIYGFINNLSKNYYSKGLNTIEKIAPKYCEGNSWAGKIHWYVNKIKNS